MTDEATASKAAPKVVVSSSLGSSLRHFEGLLGYLTESVLLHHKIHLSRLSRKILTGV